MRKVLFCLVVLTALLASCTDMPKSMDEVIDNAILKYAEDVTNVQSYRGVALGDVIRHVYPTEIANKVWNGVIRLKILVANQTNNGDRIGRDIEFEDELFPNNLDY